MFSQPPIFDAKSWRPSNQIFLKLLWKQKLTSLELSTLQKFPQIYLLNVVLDYNVTLFPSFPCVVEFYRESIYRGISDSFFFTFYFQIMHLSFFLNELSFASSTILGRCWVGWTKVVERGLWRGIHFSQFFIMFMF